MSLLKHKFIHLWSTFGGSVSLPVSGVQIKVAECVMEPQLTTQGRWQPKLVVGDH